jgi:hypothetical protein
MKSLVFSIREYVIDAWLKFFLFFINPVLGLFYSLTRPYTKSSQILFFIFGLIFAISINITFDLGFDIRAYQKKFYEVVSYLSIGDSFSDSLSKSQAKDIYIWGIAYVVALFTDNYRLFFLVMAIPFLGFAIASFRKFLSVRNTESVIAFYILMGMFFTNHYFGINGIRFWTAAWIGIFLSIKVFYEGKYRWSLLSLFLPLVHGSFYFYIFLIFLSLYCIKHRLYSRNFLIMAFGGSFILQLFSLSLLQSVLGKIGFVNDFYVSAYLSNENVESFSANRGDYSSLGNIFRILMKYYTLLLYMVLLHNYKVLIDSATKNLFVFLSIWIVFVNIVMFIPSLGERNLKMLLPVVAFIYLANFSKIRGRNIIFMFPLVYFFEMYLSWLRYSTVLGKGFFVDNFIFIINKAFY